VSKAAQTPGAPSAAERAAQADRNAVETSPLAVPKPPTNVRELEERLAEVEERDDIAHAVLSLLERRFTRRLLFMVRAGEVAAWMGSGDGVDQRLLGSFEVSFDEPSLFLNLREGSPFYRGPLPRLDAHQRLVRVWGGRYPRECLLLPVRVKQRLVAAVYCDHGASPLRGLDMEELLQVGTLMGHAFERFLLSKKKQTR
jgi:hypothetical protein